MPSDTELPIPRRPGDVTPEWLTAALATRHKGVEVTAVTTLDHVMRVGGRLRIGLEYNDVGLAAGLPSTMFVKASFTNEDLDLDLDSKSTGERTALDDMFVIETMFYRDLAPELPDLNVPQAYYVGLEDDGTVARNCILLEDLTGGVFGRFDQPLGADDVAAAIDALVPMHAAWWESPRLRETWMPTVGVVEGFVAPFMTAAAWEVNVYANPRAALLPKELSDPELMARATRAMYKHADDGPQTLIHGDAHIGNLFYRQGQDPGWLDWSNFARAPAMFDVYYFMVGSMEIEERRDHDRDLVKLYLEHLRAAGVEAPSFDAAWDACRIWSVHGFNNMIMPSYVQSEEYNGTVGRRFAMAIIDNESLTRLGVA